jgi:hypothetical protein
VEPEPRVQTAGDAPDPGGYSVGKSSSRWDSRPIVASPPPGHVVGVMEIPLPVNRRGVTVLGLRQPVSQPARAGVRA